jgi:hypothetical protein
MNSRHRIIVSFGTWALASRAGRIVLVHQPSVKRLGRERPVDVLSEAIAQAAAGAATDGRGTRIHDAEAARVRNADRRSG